MLAGASSYCYGAHGIWNVGDGKFLAQWGEQTFKEAFDLDTPRLIGLSHKEYLSRKMQKGKIFFRTRKNFLINIGKKIDRRVVQYFPDVRMAGHFPPGKIWLPLQGTYVKSIPKKGQVVIFSD